MWLYNKCCGLDENQGCNIYYRAIKTKSADNLRAIIENFINKVVVSNNEIVIEFKIILSV